MAVRYLFFDFNAYFASVEQQLQAELRGRPIAVVPMAADTTCCIAVSYEARDFGIKTGTAAGEAKRLCPHIRLVVARPRVYVKMHHRLVGVIERVVHIDRMLSVDEGVCRLLGRECETPNAMNIARQVKRAIRRDVGQYIRCSIGLGPNEILAKIATEMQKPDGLTVIEKHRLPGALDRLELQDIPGIAAAMERRCRRYGVSTVKQLCRQPEETMVKIWGGVLGKWWYHWLRGEDLPQRLTTRSTVGHSHVLPPAWRTDEKAYAVIVRMLHKAAMRLRDLGYAANELSVKVNYIYRGTWSEQGRRVKGEKWKAKGGLVDCRDTRTMLEVLGKLWVERYQCQDLQPLKVSICLSRLTPAAMTSQSLFSAKNERLVLSQAMDRLNQKYGAHTVYFGGMFGAQETAPFRISFGQVPDLDLQA